MEINLNDAASVFTIIVPIITMTAFFWRSLNKKFKVIDDKIDGLDKKFTGKIEGLDKKFTDKIDGLDKKFTDKIGALDKKFTDKIDGLDKKFTDKIGALDKKFTDKIDGLDKKIEGVKSQVDRIQGHLEAFDRYLLLDKIDRKINKDITKKNDN
jgi:hypothetical protein